MTNQLLLCTDLDRTLIPNGDAPESPNARQLFRQLVSHRNVTLAYVTGRDQMLVKEAIEQYQLPLPDFVVADVGSTIYEINHHQQWLPFQDWHRKIGRDWQHKTQPQLQLLLSDLKQCRLQEKTKQGLYKLSYYVSLDANIQQIMEQIKLRLKQEQIQSNLIWSVDEKEQVELLDILPQSANKFSAIKHIIECRKFSLENTVFSGDSGNDLDVLISPIKAILVANASQEVKEKVRTAITHNGYRDSIYIAEGKYLNMNGNYSAGIMEGIWHYFHYYFDNWLQNI